MVALIFPSWSGLDTTEKTTPAGPPRPTTGPVFVMDCVAPANGTTLLHLLWQRWDQPPEDDAAG